MEKKNLGIIFHAGTYDRIYHGFSIVLAAAALGREVKLFVTYWALEYFKKGGLKTVRFDGESEIHKDLLKKNIEKGHLQKIPELIAQAKSMGVKIYTCTNSMGILNIARDELIPEIDKSMGLTTFLIETKDSQLLFI